MRSTTARLPSASVGAEADQKYSPEQVTPKGRLFLSRRDTRSPDAARHATFEAISDWQATLVKNALGQKFRASARVVLRRPWWMPSPLYRALMRSVVVESGWEQRR